MLNIEAAVATFAQARPPGIYKGDYLKELFRRYGDAEDAPAAPPLPEWCFDEEEEDEDDDCKPGTPESEAGSSGSFSGKRRKEHLKLHSSLELHTFGNPFLLPLLYWDHRIAPDRGEIMDGKIFRTVGGLYISSLFPLHLA
ncbi:UNVERIFIED_CONTAM: hypothetical protein K2H54_066595 [Gekko kuhli]